MEVTTFTEQTRKNETLQNLEAKKSFLDKMERQLDNIETSTQRTMRYGDIWAKRQSSTTYPINDHLTRAEEFAIRAENNLRETLSVFFALHAYDGAISAQTYNSIVDQLEQTTAEVFNTLNNPGFVFTMFKNGKFQGTKLFDDKIRMKLWFKKHLNCEPDIFMNEITVPPEYRGSILAKQDWCVNPENFFSIIKNQS